METGVEEPTLGGGIDDAQGGHAVLHIGDVDGEIAAALDKLLGAVEGVDDQESGGGQRVGGGLFLGDQGHLGEGGAKTGGNDGIGGLVGLGHRRGVPLGADLEVGAVVDLKDALARLQRQSAKKRHCLGKIHHISCGELIIGFGALILCRQRNGKICWCRMPPEGDSPHVPTQAARTFMDWPGVRNP